jgi:hypothetical protein
MTAKKRARRGSPLHLHGAFELFGLSRKIVQKNIWIFGPLYAVPLLFNFHSWLWTPAIGGDVGHRWTRYSWFGSGLSASVPSYLWYSFIGFSVLWLVFVLSAGTIVQIMTQDAQLKSAQGRPLHFLSLWHTAKELGWRMFGLYLLIGLYISVGLIFFIIPGLIMLRRYFLAPYIMIDKKVGIKEAMDQSAAMTKPFSGAIWGIIGVMVLIGLTNVIPFVGWMIAFTLGLLYSVAPALRYEELKKAHITHRQTNNNEQPEEPEDGKEPDNQPTV